jgi:hypothetical protein
LVHFREICPKDFYLAQTLRTQELGYFPLLIKLILNPEVLEEYSMSETRYIFEWAVTELIHEKIFSLENWLETCFHLCKQRWDSSIDWLESQPISKVITMIDITQRFVEAQNDSMKK